MVHCKLFLRNSSDCTGIWGHNTQLWSYNVRPLCDLKVFCLNKYITIPCLLLPPYPASL